MEIERKWLLKATPLGLAVLGKGRVYQGYISRNSETEVRLRRNSATSGMVKQECTLTVKRGSGLSREEYEINLNPEQFAKLQPAVTNDELTKEPFTIYQLDNGLLLEVSNISRKGVSLIIAEVEFPSEAAAHAFIPVEFQGLIIKEVTGDKRWSMGSLSKNQDWASLLKEVYDGNTSGV